MLVQLFMSYFALATAVNYLLGFEAIAPLVPLFIALIVNTTAYNAETLRGGIAAVDPGPVGCGRVHRYDPQDDSSPSDSAAGRFRDSLPSLGNNLVVLIKDTSLVGAITLVELTYAARNVVFQTGQAFLPFLCAAGFYLVIISLVSLGVKGLEKRLQRSRQRRGRKHMTQKPLIEIETRGLEKRFGENQVLHGVDFQVHRHQVVALIGPSGSGKSTFLRCLNLLEFPDAGNIFLEDESG